MHMAQGASYWISRRAAKKRKLDPFVSCEKMSGPLGKFYLGNFAQRALRASRFF
jgi:hypothetical protein